MVNRSLAFPFSAAIFAITVAGCGNNDKPLAPERPPAAEAPAEKAAVAARPAGEATPAFSAADKDKTISNQESGDFF